MVQCLAAAGAESELARFGEAVDSVRVLKIMQLEIQLGLVTEFVAGNDAARPILRCVLVAEPVAVFAVPSQPADASIGLKRQKKLRPGKDDASAHRAGGIVQRQ